MGALTMRPHSARACAIWLALLSPLAVLPRAAEASVTLTYGPMADTRLMRQLQEARIGENMRSHLLAFAPQATFTLRLADCGEANAFFSAAGRHREIRLCTELLRHLIDQHGSALASERRSAGGAALWIAGHELGHYLLHHHQLPFLGREEDVADQVGTAVLLRSPLAREGVWGTVRYFSRPAAEQDAGDVHSLDATRRVNLACLAYGSGSEAFGPLAPLIPEQRRDGCRSEYQKFSRGIQALRRAAGRR